jgi:glycosyltransferase involved in cell wall biosynthesis
MNNMSLSLDKNLGNYWTNSIYDARSAESNVQISICIPYFRYDISPLLAELIRQSVCFGGGVEIIVADDGSADEKLINKIKLIADQSHICMSGFIFSRNIGRAAIRNRLASIAQGSYILFLDADMYPDMDNFISNYIDHSNLNFDVIVGGRSYSRVEKVDSSEALYYFFSKRSECLSAEQRQAQSWRYIFTNNVAIKRNVIIEIPFDEGYSGWGYEDTDWALSALAKGVSVLHINNTATHFGLINTNSILQKFDESVANFARIRTRFPLYIESSPVYIASRFFSGRYFPLRLLKTSLRKIILSRYFPIHGKYVALQLYKAAIYSPIT